MKLTPGPSHNYIAKASVGPWKIPPQSFHNALGCAKQFVREWRDAGNSSIVVNIFYADGSLVQAVTVANCDIINPQDLKD